MMPFTNILHNREGYNLQNDLQLIFIFIAAYK